MPSPSTASVRSVLITGCSTGIGLASARLMKSRGWRVFATARTTGDRDRLERSEGLEAVHLELEDAASIAACADSVLDRTAGRLDALFNNAAYGQVGAVEDLSPDVLRRQLEVNVVSWHDLTRRIIPAMRAAGQGRIVQCSSVLGLVSTPYRGAYCASKYAVEALADAMRIELSGTGIHVALIEPGPIRTNFVPTALAHFKRSIDIERSPHRDVYLARLDAMERGGKETFKLEPEAVALKLAHALESPKPRLRYFVTAPTYLAAGLRRVLPARLLDHVVARM
mgnify:CR=1 FL=1